MKKSLWLGSILLSAAALWAQDPNPDPNVDPNQPPAQDPPSRVARLNLVQGQVSFQPATVEEWTAATLNYPVTIGDHLYADDDGRAELHIDSTAVRLGPHSGMSFLNLDDHLAQIRLDQGALIVRVKYLEGDDAYEIDTAQGAITLLRPGEYRIDTDVDRNATMVTVRSGDAEVTSNGGSFPVHARQTAYFTGDAQPPQFQTENPNDPFDLFSMDQDRRDDRMPPPRYVSRDMPGWQDLDRNGSWSEDPAYGPVWRPTTVVVGWAPYRYGHWAWIEPWGWTWIDDAPWGFAPFHYGRWAMVGGGWAWIPGPVAPRPVYAPALVAFVGGRNFSVAVGVGGGMGAVAWFPLGPREVFVPAYHVSPVYVNRVNVTTVNVTNVTVVNRVYVNQTVGVTAVDRRAFVTAAPVHRAMVTVPPGAVGRAEVVHTAAIAPERTSILAHPGAPVNVPHPAAAVVQRPVYAQHTPPPAPVSFAARQQALQANPGRPVAPSTMNQLRTTAPVRQMPVRTLPPSNTAVRPTPQTPPPAVNRPVYQPPTQNPAGNNMPPQRTPPTTTTRPVTPPAGQTTPAARPAEMPQRPVRPPATEQTRPAETQPRPAAREERPAPRTEQKTPPKKENRKKAEEKKEEK